MGDKVTIPSSLWHAVGILGIALGAISTASAADRFWIGPTNSAPPYPSNGGAFYQWSGGQNWSSSPPTSGDRVIFSTANNPALLSAVQANIPVNVNQLLVNQGEVSLWVTAPVTINSVSQIPSNPAVDISRASSTGDGATLRIFSSAGMPSNSTFNSSGVTVIGNQSGSAGRLILDVNTGVASPQPVIYRTNGLIVGNSGQGTLIVEDGSTLINDARGFIGLNSGSTGVATVSGTGSTWEIMDGLYVGGSASASGGTGSLTVTNGGHVDVGGTLKTWNAGTVTLDGGSITTQSFDKSVGTFNFHDGTLTIDGGTYTQPTGILSISGNTTSANPTMVFTDGATAVGVAAVVVGGLSDRSGTLVIEGGSSVSNTGSVHLGSIGSEAVYGGTATLGLNSCSTGIATVTGPGSTWTNTGALYVGRSGTGTLNIGDGGEVSSAVGYIGTNSGSTGTVTVAGDDAKWTNSDALSVGFYGTGTLNIGDDGEVLNTYGYIGYNSGSTGTVTVAGDDAKWTNSDALSVGFYGTGTLNIGDDGEVSNTVGYIARISGSTGTVTVTGDNAKWTNSGTLYVGNSGNGTLNITNGGEVSSTNGIIGTSSGSTGTVTASGAGSSWTNSSGLTVGNSGNGTLTIENGAQVSNTTGFIGFDSGSTGTVAVTGAGSAWTNSGGLTVGYGGNGTLTIENGGVVSNTSGQIGRNSGSTGTVTVTGAGSLWTNSSSLEVGFQQGNGTLVIENGGAVSSTSGLIANGNGAVGNVTVAGSGSTWTNTASLFVGAGGTGVGSLTIENGGQVSNTVGYIGYGFTVGNGLAGTVSVTGAGSTWTNSGNLYVGGSSNSAGGTGSLTVANGGLVSANAATVWSTGTVTVGTGGTISATNNLITNRGLIEIATGGTINAGGVNNQGTLTNDGTINASVFTFDGGTAGGSGTYSSLTIGDGGFADPGASPGTMNSTLTAWHGGGTYLWEINSVTGTAGMDPGWDLWNTDTLTIGATDLNRFTISLNTLDSSNNAGLLGSWNASSNYSWLIATSTNGAFSSLTGLMLDFSGFLNSLSGGYFSLASGDGGNNLYINFNAASGPSPVPEPSSLVLLGCAAGGLFAGYRRRKRANVPSQGRTAA